MPSRNWSNDDELMRDLGEVLRPSPAEQRVIDAARAARGWRPTADQELAALLYDSYLDQTTPVRSGPHGEPQTLVFGHGPVQVEVELSDSGIEGQFIPPGPGVVRLCTVTGALSEAAADQVGCFAFPPPPGGPIRFECAVEGGTFVTEWIGVHPSRGRGSQTANDGDDGDPPGR